MTKRRHCLDCGTEISKNATRCQKCAAIARWADDKYRKRQTEIIAKSLRDHWQDDEYREQQERARSSPEYRRKISATARAWMQDPAHRRQLSEAAIARWNDPDYRRRVSRSVSKSVKSLWQNANYRRNQAQGRRSPKYRRIRSQIAKAAWSDPAHRRKMSATMKTWWRKRRQKETKQ